ncbi:hypothetical protein CEXT_690011 [Caerostris extrusa]|uniref:Uncharacterized protein n=1 Tax=Caerostris extrusa TaxID=172846 RepID=A0AAV4NLD7_CAEEX|nr:hypothetical protein CEXT_690011 [Caerostris extrusa]
MEMKLLCRHRKCMKSIDNRNENLNRWSPRIRLNGTSSKSTSPRGHERKQNPSAYLRRRKQNQKSYRLLKPVENCLDFPRRIGDRFSFSFFYTLGHKYHSMAFTRLTHSPIKELPDVAAVTKFLPLSFPEGRRRLLRAYLHLHCLHLSEVFDLVSLFAPKWSSDSMTASSSRLYF